MNKNFTKITTIAILLFVFQITLKAQPVGSQIKVGTDSHISYWNGSTWEFVQSGFPGQSLQFLAGVPTWVYNPNGITTTAASSITGTTAISGGNILSDGGATITVRGVCWSTSANPTIADNKTIDGNGIGSFTSNLTDLNDGLTYYIRSYATNINGTRYGNEISFLTPFPIYDIDGNSYDTVHVGTQVWMKQNLNTSRYNNGVAIPNVTDIVTWADLSTGARCYYSNDSVSYASTYGALYNWYAVNTGNLCPTGWHVPTDAEWTTLTTYLGGASIAGGKLKAITLWHSPNTGATNSSGFSALPGGYRRHSSSYSSIGLDGNWWSSTEYNTPYAWYKHMSYDYINAIRYYDYKKLGFSVRCVRD